MKTEFKEWRIETTDDDKNVFIVDDIYAIAKVSEIQGKEQRIANAKLIAAAPEMLDALMDVVRILESNPTYTNLYQRNKINALIEKATE